jgi:hypothetical protein
VPYATEATTATPETATYSPRWETATDAPMDSDSPKETDAGMIVLSVHVLDKPLRQR